MTDWTRVPGYVSHRDGPEMPTVTIETERIREACEHARDELGFDMCVDVVATDYLGWGGKGVSGYIGTSSGRDLMRPMTQGLQTLPELKPKRFSVSYHLLALDGHRQLAERLRLRDVPRRFAPVAHVATPLRSYAGGMPARCASCRRMIPSISASGRGGQNGT